MMFCYFCKSVIWYFYEDQFARSLEARNISMRKKRIEPSSAVCMVDVFSVFPFDNARKFSSEKISAIFRKIF